MMIFKTRRSFIFITVLFFTGCTSRTYVVESSVNPPYRPNTSFTAYEDIDLPRFDSLKSIYQLDTLFHGEQDELKRILLLRNWIRSKIPINDFGDPYPGDDHPRGIIDAGISGQGFHCGHYMVVQNAVMNAYGYVTRCLGAGPGLKGTADGHHGMNEIWLNKFNKWFLSDAKFDHHFEKDGIPLSAIEVRDEFLKNRAADVTLVKGPNRQPITSDVLADEKGVFQKKNKEWFAQWYTWLEWDKSNNRFSAWPQFETPLNMYEDEFFAKNTWYWDGKPHWAYNSEHMIKVKQREAIEWTPNTISGNVEIAGNNAVIKLTSSTPNFEEYQVKEKNDEQWKRCDSIVSLPLTRDKHEFAFRAVNAANVAGPEYKVVIRAQ